jgi:transcriptional regulator with XRE-family HTH domain
MTFWINLWEQERHDTKCVSAIRLLLGARIEELRDARRLTRAGLAELLGVDARQIAAYELNGMWPGPEMAIALAEAFHIDLCDL